MKFRQYSPNRFPGRSSRKSRSLESAFGQAMKHLNELVLGLSAMGLAFTPVATAHATSPAVSVPKRFLHHKFSGSICNIAWVGDERHGRFMVSVNDDNLNSHRANQEEGEGARFHAWLVDPDHKSFKYLGIAFSAGEQQCSSFVDIQTGPRDITRIDVQSGKEVVRHTLHPIRSFCFDRTKDTFCYVPRDSWGVFYVDEKQLEKKLSAWLKPPFLSDLKAKKPDSVNAVFNGSCLVRYCPVEEGVDYNTDQVTYENGKVVESNADFETAVRAFQWVSLSSGKPQGEPLTDEYTVCSAQGLVTTMDGFGRLQTRAFRNSRSNHRADISFGSEREDGPIPADKIYSHLASPEVMIATEQIKGRTLTVTYHAYTPSTGKLRKVWKQKARSLGARRDSYCLSATGRVLAIQTDDSEVDFIHVARRR